jgi:hypothetical protein
MAGLTVSPDQIATARKAGYSDDDIANFLAPKAPDQFAAAAKAGYSATEILQHLAPQPSGIVDNLVQGGADALGGVGSTIEKLAGPGLVSGWMQSEAKSIAPKDFVPSSIIDKSGFHTSAILPTLARGAAPTAAAILAGMAAPEALGTAGAVAAGTSAGLAMNTGNQIQTAADNRTGQPNSPSTGADTLRGLLTALPQAAVQAVPLGRYLAPAAALEKTGAAGVTGALKDLGTTAVTQGGANAASDVIGQVGQTIGTPGGTQVDPTQAANAGVVGATTGGLFGANRAVRTGLDAAKYREITPDLQPAATQVANRLQQNADGENLNAGLVGGGAAQRTGADAFNKTKAAISNELSTAATDLQTRTTLPTDAQNVLKATLNGQMPNQRDYGILGNAVQSDPQGANLMNLVRQAHVADIVENSGHLSDDKFSGGIASHITGMLTGHNVAKTGLVALGGAALEGGAGHLIAYSPEVMAGVAGAGALARLADNITGARAPVGRFVRNFADGTTPVRLPAPQAPQPPPTAPVARPGPTGPSVPPTATPWGNGPSPVATGTTIPPVAGGSILTPAVQQQIALRANLAKIAAAQSPQPVAAPAQINPLALPKEITGPAANIMRGAALAQKLKAETLGQEAAKAEVNASPYIEQKVGSAANIPSPAAAKYMAKAVSGANVLAKLQSDPEAQAEAAEQEKASAASIKSQAKAATALAKVTAKASQVPAKGPIDLPAVPLRGAADPVMDLGAMRAAVKGAPAPAKSEAAPQITSVTKTNGTVGVAHNQDEYVVPRSPYAHLVPSAAAQQFLADAQKGGATIASKQGFLNGTQRNISDIRARAIAVARDAPGVNPNEIAAQFEGVSTQKSAIAHREWLKKQMPQAAAALDQHFSDEVIQGTKERAGIWKRKGT